MAGHETPPVKAKPRTAKTLEQALLDQAPWLPPHAELADYTAMQALAAGTADKEQQQRALRWIIEKGARTYDFSYRPGTSDRETNIALGRQFVGQQIVKLIRTNVAKLKGGGNEQG